MQEGLFALRDAATAANGKAELAEAVETRETSKEAIEGAAEPRQLPRAWSSDHDEAVDDLLNREHLCKLLDSPPGQRWLSSAELRRSIEQFIAVQRTEKEDPHDDKEGAVPQSVLGAIERADKVEGPVDMGGDDYWCRIPAGTFQMGAQPGGSGKPNYDKDAQSNELPVHEVELRSYRVGRNSVTVAEFSQFLGTGAYIERVFWKAGGFKTFEQPEGWENQIEHPNRPVTGVSWYEAVAYAVWAAVSLPSEAQWERVARSAEGRRYPWGDEKLDASRANYGIQIGNATPVGVYPRGATPDGVLDMAGNVWEWCADVWHDDYDGAPSDGSAWTSGGTQDARVIRGGTWDNDAIYLRSAYRSWSRPVIRYDVIGFRVSAGT